jgi:hypothetical protein
MPLAELSEDPKPTPSGKDATPPVDSAAKMRKQVFLQFGAIIALGLALAGWYVAYRVVTARAAQPLEPGMAIVVHTPAQPQPIPTRPITTPLAVESKPAEIPATSPPVVKPVAVAPVQAGPSVAAAPEIAKPVKAPQPAKRSDAPSQPFRRHEASPRIGEKYLQIAAFGPRALDGYLKTLEGQGLHPLVAPGPADSIYRILVGPFASAEALEETRRSIQASGIEPILRTY